MDQHTYQSESVAHLLRQGHAVESVKLLNGQWYHHESAKRDVSHRAAEVWAAEFHAATR